MSLNNSKSWRAILFVTPALILGVYISCLWGFSPRKPIASTTPVLNVAPELQESRYDPWECSYLTVPVYNVVVHNTSLWALCGVVQEGAVRVSAERFDAKTGVRHIVYPFPQNMERPERLIAAVPRDNGDIALVWKLDDPKTNHRALALNVAVSIAGPDGWVMVPQHLSLQPYNVFGVAWRGSDLEIVVSGKEEDFGEGGEDIARVVVDTKGEMTFKTVPLDRVRAYAAQRNNSPKARGIRILHAYMQRKPKPDIPQETKFEPSWRLIATVSSKNSAEDTHWLEMNEEGNFSRLDIPDCKNKESYMHRECVMGLSSGLVPAFHELNAEVFVRPNGVYVSRHMERYKMYTQRTKTEAFLTWNKGEADFHEVLEDWEKEMSLVSYEGRLLKLMRVSEDPKSHTMPHIVLEGLEKDHDLKPRVIGDLPFFFSLGTVPISLGPEEGLVFVKTLGMRYIRLGHDLRPTAYVSTVWDILTHGTHRKDRIGWKDVLSLVLFFLCALGPFVCVASGLVFGLRQEGKESTAANRWTGMVRSVAILYVLGGLLWAISGFSIRFYAFL